MSDEKPYDHIRNFVDPIRDPYTVDFFDPSTWSRGVFGVGARPLGVADHEEEDAFERHVRRQRHQSAQQHAGKGPKNYKRSDARISEDVNEALLWSRDVDATEITVEIQDGVVVLSGRVPTRYQKYVAEDLAMHIRGVQSVTNQLEIINNYRFGARIGGWPI